jgi:hypothetical protein
MVVVALQTLGFQAQQDHPFRFMSALPLMCAGLLVGLLFLGASLWPGLGPRLRVVWARVRGMAVLPWVLALGWAAVFVISCFYRSVEISQTDPVLKNHLPFTMGEFAAVLNGRTPLVDFFAQYQNVLTLVLAPLFKLTGLGPTVFTAAMSGLALLGLGFLFSVLGRVCGNRWGALALFVPMVAMAFYSETGNQDVYRTHAFIYYAVGPLRYFGPCFLAWVAARYLTRPCPIRLMSAAALSLLVALNNLDFGVPAVVGVLACAIMFPPAFAGGQFRRIVGAVALFAVTALATLGVYGLFIRLWAGQWPMLGQLVVYQRAFALIGFYMIPMPEMGLHWIVYLTIIAAVLIPVFETFSSDSAAIADNRRLINGCLVYSGFAAFGPLTYYAGRSHPRVLEAAFLWWIFILAQLVNRAWHEWRGSAHQPRKLRDLLLPLPVVATFGMFLLVSSTLGETPDPIDHLSRLTKTYPETSSVESAQAPLVRLIGKYLSPGSTGMIVHQDAHWLAMRAGINNVFPFAHDGSLLLKEQLNVVMAALVRVPGSERYVFGAPVPELLVRLKDNGFTRIDGIGGFGVWRAGTK